MRGSSLLHYKTPPKRRLGVLVLDGYAGRTETTVVIVGETPKRFRIRPTGTVAVKLGGCERWLLAGQTALVPKTAIREASHDERSQDA